MSGTTNPVPLQRPADPAAPKQRRKRSPSVAKPAFFIVQILGEDGQPMSFDKKRVKLVAVERSAEKVMDAMEGGTYPNAFYLRGIVPAGRGQTKPA
jgi:hypothetical protein